jgi:hypothetical protein
VVACQRILVRGGAGLLACTLLSLYTYSCGNWCQGCKKQLVVACQRILDRGKLVAGSLHISVTVYMFVQQLVPGV